MRIRYEESVHYVAGIIVLFDRCFWSLQIESEEQRLVGNREGAVARRLMDESPSGIPSNFDPYAREWDGIVPMEEDPLTRVRMLGRRLRESLQLGEAIDALAPFAP